MCAFINYTHTSSITITWMCVLIIIIFFFFPLVSTLNSQKLLNDCHSRLQYARNKISLIVHVPISSVLPIPPDLHVPNHRLSRPPPVMTRHAHTPLKRSSVYKSSTARP